MSTWSLIQRRCRRLGRWQHPPPRNPLLRNGQNLVICLFASVGLILIALGSVSEGLTGLALAMGVASVVRLVLPSTTAGWLTSRLACGGCRGSSLRWGSRWVR